MRKGSSTPLGSIHVTLLVRSKQKTHFRVCDCLLKCHMPTRRRVRHFSEGCSGPGRAVGTCGRSEPTTHTLVFPSGLFGKGNMTPFCGAHHFELERRWHIPLEVKSSDPWEKEETFWECISEEGGARRVGLFAPESSRENRVVASI